MIVVISIAGIGGDAQKSHTLNGCFRNRYSDPKILIFFKIIQGMTRLDPTARPTMSEVVSSLKTLIGNVKVWQILSLPCM